ncbi:MAG: hypothetical protein H7234_07745 [Herminiimonas sp.]|nr:hypothetical protein [Herminiimonas sp.]
MKKNLYAGLSGIVLSLIASAALADQAPALSVNEAPSALPCQLAIAAAQQPADMSEATLLTLTDGDMDKVVAAGQVTAAQARASTLKGHAFAFSTTNLVASQIVGVSIASSLAIAIGVHPQTLTSASAASF